MTFSYSSWRTYQQCQRKWLYSSKVKAPNTKDTHRKKVSILSTLQTISAWRGEIVDYTLSKFVIPKIDKGEDVSLADAVSYAKKLCRKRYEFAKSKKYWEPDIKRSTTHQYQYSALIEYEFETGITNDEFKNAWTEIELSLTNFFENEELLAKLKRADYLAPQKSLFIKVNDFSVRGVPDLILFKEGEPPEIIDWKVHHFATKTYNEQLLIYAYALSNVNHAGFPPCHRTHSVFDYKIHEYQLLVNEFRTYSITEDYIEDIKDFLTEKTYQLHLAGGESKYGKIEMEDFEVTSNPENCITCPFQKICSDEN